MSFDLKNLTLIDLISEKHAYLRRKAEQRWESHSDIHFSHSELFLLSRVNHDNLSISQAASILGVSRQAMQKSVKKLETSGYIVSRFKEGNKRDKFLFLTKSGQELCDVNEQLKLDLEHELEAILGKSEIENLRKLFVRHWDME